MNRIHIQNLPTDFVKGVSLLEREYAFMQVSDGLPVTVTIGGAEIIVNTSKAAASISCPNKAAFFRGLGLLLEALREDHYVEVREPVHFSMAGVMFDVSQGNAALLPETFERLLRRMAVMGLNMLMIYMEDSYVIDGEPFFGYMRARYTQEELKRIDDYAELFGIEVIPSVQTLAHLADVLKWGDYSEVTDCDDILLVGHEGTYALIERMLKAASAPFRTQRIHIGMDEAWRLGRGKYQDSNGVESKYDIMRKHLTRVTEIVYRLGLVPMMWSDMFFFTPDLKGYGNNYNPDAPIPQETIDSVPKPLDLVFWEYNRDDEAFYRKVIDRHKEFGTKVIWAGSIYGHEGFGINYGLSFRATEAAFTACKKAGVSEVIATFWGDDGTESNIFEWLLGLQLYAEHAYCEQLDEQKLMKRFAFCTGGNYDDFLSLKYMDETPGVPNDNMGMSNPSKYLLWQNPLLGLFDANIDGLGLSHHYQTLAEQLENAVHQNGEFGFVFELCARVCRVLEDKAELGLGITAAYRADDREKLAGYAQNVLPRLKEKLQELRLLHRRLWFETNKPEGWEIIDLRYGAQWNALDTAEARINAYLQGNSKAIPELENERLLYPSVVGLPAVYRYSQMVSASRMSQ